MGLTSVGDAAERAEWVRQFISDARGASVTAAQVSRWGQELYAPIRAINANCAPTQPKVRTDGELGFVYFITDEDDRGPIKIGFSVRPEARLSALQTANHAGLKIMAVVRGTRTTESRLHDTCRQWHIRGEWFHRDDGLLKVIRGVTDQADKLG